MRLGGIVLALLAVACSGGEGKDGGPKVEICTNTVDDDGDGLADCQDVDDCGFVCGEICGDGIDNDLDGMPDCEDQGCDGQCPEVCDDGRDNDGDGTTDCQDPECTPTCPEDCANALDDDGDFAVDCEDPDCASTCDGDGDGHVAVALGGDDCDDADEAVHPEAPEVCNGVDDDCDLEVDDDDGDLADGEDYYADQDGDGFGNPFQKLERCEQPGDTVENALDCDDADPAINPDGVEVCNQGRDDDCSGLADDADPNLDTSTWIDWYVDDDGDGYGVPSTPITQCAQPPDRADNDDDCNDANPALGAPQTWARDTDDDGYGGGTPTAPLCFPPGPDWVATALGDDCDDGDPAVGPGFDEVCADGIDQDCDGADFVACTDTAAFLQIHGYATVDTVAGTYTGEEWFEYVGTSTGWLVCEWTWTMLDWQSDPTAIGADPLAAWPCTDPDGNPCAWRTTAHGSNGAMTGGTDCAFYGLTPASATLSGPWGYGWTNDYQVGGNSYGPSMMYFYAPAGLWLGLQTAALFPVQDDYDALTGDFSYDWLEFATLPTP